MLGDEFVESIVEFVVPDREFLKLLVGLQQLIFQRVRLCIHAAPPSTWRESNTTDPDGSRSAIAQPLTPQHEGILDRSGVIGAADARHRKTEAFLQLPCGIIRPPDLAGRAPGAALDPRPQRAGKKSRRHPA